MLKSILACIDDTPASDVARDLAFALAKEHGATVSGMTVIDDPWLAEGKSAPIGGAHYVAEMLEKREAAAKARAEAARGRFDATSRKAGMGDACAVVSGAPAAAVSVAAHAHDLIAMGHDVSFHGGTRDGVPEVVNEIVRHGPRPVALTPAKTTEGRGSLIAYDGSLPATRALQMFVLLGLAKEAPVRLLQLGHSPDGAGVMESAEAFLRHHEIEPELKTLHVDAHPADSITIEADALRPRWVVLGAYGHTRMHDWIFGSTTRKLLANPPTTLFVHH